MIGRDINLPEAQLQWLLSAYALSSVSDPYLGPYSMMNSAVIASRIIGLSCFVLWSARRPVWTKTGLHARYGRAGNIRGCWWVCVQSVSLVLVIQSR